MERAIEDLDPADGGDDETDAPPEITIRGFLVDADGECAGQARELRVSHSPDGTRSVERETFDLPNDRRGAEE
ncbi:hypothetical protein [Halopelagius fulvigenes]|uniref:Uncharacterized protein n=1 Tax=Halopelagius fulvigenes TaxID=1198324 RepID=A0ABD5TTG6_9EURY